jgi:hypothetical protein
MMSSWNKTTDQARKPRYANAVGREGEGLTPRLRTIADAKGHLIFLPSCRRRFYWSGPQN